jgi:hypothetical protein
MLAAPSSPHRHSPTPLLWLLSLHALHPPAGHGSRRRDVFIKTFEPLLHVLEPLLLDLDLLVGELAIPLLLCLHPFADRSRFWNAYLGDGEIERNEFALRREVVQAPMSVYALSEHVVLKCGQRVACSTDADRFYYTFGSAPRGLFLSLL